MNSGLQSGRGLSQPGQTTTLNIRPKILSCSPDFSLGIPTETLAVTTWAPSAGEVEVACPASLTQVGHHDLPQRPSWVGFSLCSQNHQAPAGPAPAQLRGGGCWPGQRAVGPRTPLRSPSRVVGHCSCWSCLLEEALRTQKPPREFPFWKVGSSSFMTFSRGGGRGTGWVYGSDTICVMTSAPTRPLSSVNSWEGPGTQAVKASGPG